MYSDCTAESLTKGKLQNEIPSLPYISGTPSHQSNKPQKGNVWLDLLISLVQSYLEDLILEAGSVSVQLSQVKGQADSGQTQPAGPAQDHRLHIYA